MKTKKKYTKPVIKAKKIKVNFFLTRNRFYDSFDSLMMGNSHLLAQSSCSCGCCFLEGTMISMSNGDKKPIENINPGEIVYSFDLTSKKIIPNNVVKLLVHPTTVNGYLIINNDVKVTSNHEVFVNSNTWKTAGELKIGDKLTSADAKEIQVISIEKVDGTNETYNLHLSGPHHNYFANGILVHNAPK